MFPWTDNAGVLNIGFGTHSALEVWQGGQLFDVTPFGPPTRLGSAPLAVTNVSATVVVTHTAHGIPNGTSVKIFGALDTGGITAANLNGTRTITVIGVDSYSFVAGANATSTTTGGGTNVVATPQTLLAAGAINGTGGSGWGTGAYGVGGYGLPSTADFFPRTWSNGAWGQNWLASPRNGGIYTWNNVTATKAVALDGAPTQVTQMLVAPISGGYMLFALGTQEEVSGVFNPMCIRHSAVRSNTSWSTSTTTSREYILTGGGHIVAGRMCGPYLLVWTDDSLFLGTYTGGLVEPWKFTRVGRNCGLIGPNAAVVVGQAAYWCSPDKQFYRYGLGGQPEAVPCPILDDFRDHFAASQMDKVVASSNATFSEVRFDYPDDREGTENSRFVRLCVSGQDAGSWSGGEQARTAFVDAGPSLYPIGVTSGGNVYYHEKGHSADGSAFAWYITSAAQLLDVDWRMLVKGVWPDFQDQLGPVIVSLTARETPQDTNAQTMTAAPMAPGDMRADLLLTGRLFEVTFSGDSSPTRARLGRPVFEVERAGKI